MEFSKETPIDQIKSWKMNIDMFKNKCPNKLISQRVKEIEDDVIVQQKKKGLEAEKKALAGKFVKLAEAALQQEDPTKEIMDSFADIKGNLVSALNKEMKFENLVE